MISVKELLQTQMFKDSVVLAGKEGLNREVETVSVIESPDGVRFFKGKELVVTTAYAFKDSPEAMTELISNLVSKDVGVLAVKLRHIKKLPEQVAHKADELRFPIITLNEQYSWLEIIDYVTGTLYKANNEGVDEISDLYHYFIQEPSRKRDQDRLPFIANKLSSLGHCNLVIMNGLTTEVYRSGREPVHLEKIIDHKENWQRETLHEKLSSYFPYPVILYSVIIGGKEHFWRGVEVAQSGVLSWYVWFFDEKKKVGQEDLPFFQFATSIILMEVQRKEEIFSLERKCKNLLLDELIYGEPGPQEAIKERGAKLGWVIPPNFQVYVLELGLEGKISQGHLHPIMKRIKNSWGAKNIFWGVSRANEFILVLPAGQFKLDALISMLERQLKATGIRVGVSGEKSCPLALKKAYQEAGHALAIGTLLGDQQRFYLYEELGFYKILSVPLAEEKLREFFNKYLGRLEKYDQEKGANLMGTLKVFLACLGNYRETARRLHLHHNSVRYRAKMIENLAQASLQNPEDRLNMEIAFKIKPLIK